MTKRSRDLANRGTGEFTAGTGHVARPAGPVTAARGGSFALVFSEVIPVGLLADISGHLRVSIGTAVVAAAGSLTLLCRVGAAISSPPAGSDGLTRERARRTS